MDWTLGFGMADAPGFGSDFKPIWQVLSERGYRVGVMNLPTMFPAQQVNGFFVCGGGGGAPVLREPSRAHCYPPEIHGDLLAMGYIVDERQNTLIGDSGLTSVYGVLAKLAHKNNRRAHAFANMARRFDIDFGFVVFKSSSVLAELVVMPELEAAARENMPACVETIRAVEEYYRSFDEEIKKLILDANAEEVLFVSDHGSVVPKTRFNPNAWLQAHGFQQRSAGRSFSRQVISKTKWLFPYTLRRKIKNHSVVKKGWNKVAVAASRDSKAFSALIGSWRNGIYVNDEQRFGGCVAPASVPAVAEEIVSRINLDTELAQGGVTARIAVSPHKTSPDILLDMPDTTFMSPASPKVFDYFPLPKPPLGLKPLIEGKQLCVKSKLALSVNVAHEWSREDSREIFDLTDVYKHVVSRFPPRGESS